MRRGRPLVVLAVLAVAVVGAAGAVAVAPAAVSAQARIRSAVDTTLVTVGDRITLTVQVTHGAEDSVVWPDSVDLSPFEVMAAQLEPPVSGAEGTLSTARFSLAAFELGELELPAMPVRLLRGDGTSETLETDRFGIEVVSVGADEGGDIREIRGPLSIPLSAARIALLALLFTLLGAALVLGWRRWRDGRAGDVPVESGPPPRPPHEVALEALEALAASPMLERGEVKAYHIEASEIVRRYIEDALHVRALEMTTWELLEGLERRGAPDALRADARRFLDQCDRVKFAKVRPDVATSREAVDLGRAVVEAGAGWVREEQRGAEGSGEGAGVGEVPSDADATAEVG